MYASTPYAGTTYGYLEVGGCSNGKILFVPAQKPAGSPPTFDFLAGGATTCTDQFTAPRNGKQFRTATLDEAKTILFANAAARFFQVSGAYSAQAKGFNSGGYSNASDGYFFHPDSMGFDAHSGGPAGVGYPSVCVSN